MNIFKVNTTAYKEEDFYIQSSLTAKQIIDVIKPIVMKERFGGDDYDNYDLIKALKDVYPSKKIEYYYEFETISI